jgi:hypothetical protein
MKNMMVGSEGVDVDVDVGGMRVTAVGVTRGLRKTTAGWLMMTRMTCRGGAMLAGLLETVVAGRPPLPQAAPAALPLRAAPSAAMMKRWAVRALMEQKRTSVRRRWEHVEQMRWKRRGLVATRGGGGAHVVCQVATVGVAAAVWRWMRTVQSRMWRSRRKTSAVAVAVIVIVTVGGSGVVVASGGVATQPCTCPLHVCWTTMTRPRSSW